MFSIVIFLFLTMILVQQGMHFLSWLACSAAYGIFAYIFLQWSSVHLLLFYSFLALVFALSIYSSWMKYVSRFFYKNILNFIPRLSDTEEQALKVGDAWLEKMIFTGDIEWSNLKKAQTHLTQEEEQFLNEETEILCRMLDEWEIHQLKDLPAKVWQYIKDQGFLGLVISKDYGGKGFSARAHSDIIMKIASRSAAAAVTVMVPNSLGPGELLMHYGTDEQKKYYLPRLAKGLEIPCFALTEPEAGSDATSIQSSALVCRQYLGNQQILGLKISLNKRWITLAPVATLIGVAVQLKDPDGLLEGIGQEGITCVLIPRDTVNLEIGPRHIPANQSFMNGTIQGQDIFIPIDNIIGGQTNAGHGWHMLVECLSIGRSISLPALASASSAVSYLSSGAFSRLRRQFNTDIVHFEGIQEKLASIAGLHYLINVNRLQTLAAVDAGIKPAVASAIAKCFNTELGRTVVNEAMDVHAGRLVVEGPRNYLMNHYQGIPISVTVEGANIMTRNLLIFGQGSMMCHPYIRQEFYAIREQDFEAFNLVLWQHVAYQAKNFCKSFVAQWTGPLLIHVPASVLKKERRRFLKLSYAFAWVADIALMTLGGTLKRKERLSGRLADVFSYLYLAMAVFADVDAKDNLDDTGLLQARWALAYCFAKAQAALLGFIAEYPIKPLAILMRLVAAPFGQIYKMPNDNMDKQLALAMSCNHHYREALKKNIYLSGDAQQALDRVEMAWQQALELQDLYSKFPNIRQYKFAQLPTYLDSLVKSAQMTEAEKQAILLAETARYDAMQVDSFVLKRENTNVYYEAAEPN